MKSFRPLSAAEKAKLLERTREAALRGRYERFKTASDFDGTAERPGWLGP